MEGHYFNFDEEAGAFAADSRGKSNYHNDNNFSADATNRISPGSAGDVSATLPFNYTFSTKEVDWTLPMVPFAATGSNFTTSPVSTATHGLFSTYSDGHNPFEASFGGIAYSDSSQQGSYDFPNVQLPLYPSSMGWSPPASTSTCGYPSNTLPLNTDIFHAPQPQRHDEDFGSHLRPRGHVELLENRAITLLPPRKRRRTEESLKKDAGHMPTPTGSPIRSSILKSEKGFEPDIQVASTIPLVSRRDGSPTSMGKEKTQHKSNHGSRVLDKEKERHKHVEMKYRKQMKDRFEELLSALPVQMVNVDMDGKSGVVFQKKIRRGKVLDLAKEHIEFLERDREHLERERQLLQREMKIYEDAWMMPGQMMLMK